MARSPRCAKGTGISRSPCSSAIQSISSGTLVASICRRTARTPSASEYFFSRSVPARSTPVITSTASAAKRAQSCSPHTNGRSLRSSKNALSRVGQSGKRFIFLPQARLAVDLGAPFIFFPQAHLTIGLGMVGPPHFPPPLVPAPPPFPGGGEGCTSAPLGLTRPHTIES